MSQHIVTEICQTSSAGRESERVSREIQAELANKPKSSLSTSEGAKQTMKEQNQYVPDEYTEEEINQQAFYTLYSGFYQAPPQYKSEEENQEVIIQQYVTAKQQIGEGGEKQIMCGNVEEKEESVLDVVGIEERGDGDGKMVENGIDVQQPKLQLVPQQLYLYPHIEEEQFRKQIVQPRQVHHEQQLQQIQVEEQQQPISAKQPKQQNIKHPRSYKQIISQQSIQIQQLQQRPQIKQPIIQPIEQQHNQHNEAYPIPSIQQLSPPQHYKIHIYGYYKKYFMKLETQIYQIEVQYNKQKYVINRKFADFASLQTMIRSRYPGYILYPFPQKNIELLTTIKLSMGNQIDKVLSIQKRLLELEKYLQFIAGHEELGKSVILELFMKENQEEYMEQWMRFIGLMGEEEQELLGTVIKNNIDSLKNIVKKGLGIFNGYFSKVEQQDNQKEVQLKEFKDQAWLKLKEFQSISAQIEECLQRVSHFYQRAQNLLQIYKQSKQVQNIDSNIDSVLILSSKLSSSKSYYQQIYDWIDDNLISELSYFLSLFIQIKQQTQYRTNLLSRISALNTQQLQTCQTILTRITTFDSQFLPNWKTTVSNYNNKQSSLYFQFNKYWKQHCQLMTKIWR